MKNYDLITPEGTKDLLFGECIVRRNIENSLMGLFRSIGYSETITPGLEFYDVFNLNSRYFNESVQFSWFLSYKKLLTAFAFMNFSNKAKYFAVPAFFCKSAVIKYSHDIPFVRNFQFSSILYHELDEKAIVRTKKNRQKY